MASLEPLNQFPLPPAAYVGLVWIGLVVIFDATAQFWAFLNSSTSPARGTFVLPMDVAVRFQR